MTARVLVGILNFNAIDDCVSTVRSLRELRYPAFDVIVVDNASTNDARARVAELCPEIVVEANAVNSGFAGGMNSILDRATERGYDYAVLANNDIALAPDALEHLVTTAQAHPEAAIIGGLEVGWESGDVRAVGGTDFNLVLGRQRWTRDVPAQPSTVEYPQGALLLVATEAVRRGLRMDDRLFMYYEEVDLGFRLRALNRVAIVDPAVRVRHKAESRHLVPRGAYYQQRNRLYLARTYGTPLQFISHVVIVGMIELPAKMLIRSAQGHGRFALACARGFLDGLVNRMGAGRGSRLG